MQKHLISFLNRCARKFFLLSLILCSFSVNAQDTIAMGITITEKMQIEFPEGHSCMTQTRAASKEEALYGTHEGGPRKYTLTKKGQVFSCYHKNEKNKWYVYKSFTVLHSFEDEYIGNQRFTFLCDDGTSITCVPDMDSEKLVILDVYGAEHVLFIHD